MRRSDTATFARLGRAGQWEEAPSVVHAETWWRAGSVSRDGDMTLAGAQVGAQEMGVFMFPIKQLNRELFGASCYY